MGNRQRMMRFTLAPILLLAAYFAPLPVWVRAILALIGIIFLATAATRI